jgi:hypothetical protein
MTLKTTVPMTYTSPEKGKDQKRRKNDLERWTHRVSQEQTKGSTTLQGARNTNEETGTDLGGRRDSAERVKGKKTGRGKERRGFGGL